MPKIQTLSRKLGGKASGLFSAIMVTSLLTIGSGVSTIQAQQLGRDPAVIVGKLPNGLTYYIRPNQRPENRADLRLVINAGSVLEDPDQLGHSAAFPR